MVISFVTERDMNILFFSSTQIQESQENQFFDVDVFFAHNRIKLSIRKKMLSQKKYANTCKVSFIQLYKPKATCDNNSICTKVHLAKSNIYHENKIQISEILGSAGFMINIDKALYCQINHKNHETDLDESDLYTSLPLSISTV